MLTRIIFTLLCFLVCILNIRSQNTIVIKQIEFVGVEKNDPEFLSNRLGFAVGDSVTSDVLDQGKQRLINLFGIYAAEYASSDGSLTYHIEEKHTLLPVINFGGIKGNVWFQAGVKDINWLGKGHQLLAFYQNNDRRHSGELHYRIPWLGSSQWGLSFLARKWSSIEPLFFEEGAVRFNYDNNAIGAGAIRHINNFHRIEADVSYFIESYTKNSQQNLENPPGPDKLSRHKLMYRLQYRWDKINYHGFTLSGFVWHNWYQTVYSTEDADYFNSLISDFRQYIPIGRSGNLAFKLRAAISSNDATPFAPFVVDSHVNLRGVGNRIDRGTAQLIINLEYRHKFFESDKWAAQWIVFTDAGSWRNPGGELKQLFEREQFRQFVGGGMRLIFKRMHDAILRIDYGVDIYHPEQRGLVIGIGQYF